jgi:hypothetical protein
MDNDNKQTELKDNMLSEKEHTYYGTEREWCVGKITGDTMVGTTERRDTYSDDTLVFQLDFGKPRPDNKHKSQERIGIHSFDFQEVVSHLVDDVMESGVRGIIEDECVERFKKDYEIVVRYRSYTKGSDWMNHVSCDLKKKETATPIATISNIKPYLADNEYDVNIYWEGMSYFTTQKNYYGENALRYMVNKFLKEKYTYCTKMGRNIVPDDYIKLGKVGIERWRQEKSNSNKNNSIEKQTIKKIKNEKKNNAFKYFNDAMRAMLNERGSHDWGTVFLAVDGRWNTGRRVKTVNKGVLNVTDDELITMSDEEIRNRCKEYWKKELEKAIERIEELDFDNNNNN